MKPNEVLVQKGTREIIRQQAKKEVFDNIDEIFQLNDTHAIRIYAECKCCSRFVKKLSEVKEHHLNTNNTEEVKE